MVDNLREFVYLDTTSVNSLLASRFMAVPQQVREVAEKSEEQTDEAEVSAGISLHSLLNLGGSGRTASTEGSRELSEVGKRINDQYRFSILIRALEQSEDTEIHDLSTDSTKEDLETGDLVKIEATCTTDPLYPLLTALHYFLSATRDIPESDSFWSSLLQNQSDFGQIEQIYELLYGGWIGLKTESDSVGMAIDEGDTWVDPHREFRGTNKYTIFGRVQEKLSEGQIWDLIEILRVLDSASSEQEMEGQRLEMIAKLLDELEEQNEENEFELPKMDPKEFIVEGEATIVNPIAIYW